MNGPTSLPKTIKGVLWHAVYRNGVKMRTAASEWHFGHGHNPPRNILQCMSCNDLFAASVSQPMESLEGPSRFELCYRCYEKACCHA